MAYGRNSGPRTVIAIDFGTTFTGQWQPRNKKALNIDLCILRKGLAWIDIKHGQEPTLADVQVFENWPGGRTTKVPSAISFDPTTEEAHEQWGHDIERNSLTVMRWTKLELEAGTKLLELQRLAGVAKGLRLIAQFRADPNAGSDNSVPEHLTLSAEDIVAFLLRKIVRTFWHDRQADNRVAFSASPVDLIITHPAVCTGFLTSDGLHFEAYRFSNTQVWSYEARNKTVRAVLGAFQRPMFPTLQDIFMCSEPEASALYTAMTATTRQRGRLVPVSVSSQRLISNVY
jgi:hypothetical protein